MAMSNQFFIEPRQAEKLHKRVAMTYRDFDKIAKRMDALRFDPEDSFYRAVRETLDVMHGLWVTTHYLTYDPMRRPIRLLPEAEPESNEPPVPLEELAKSLRARD